MSDNAEERRRVAVALRNNLPTILDALDQPAPSPFSGDTRELRASMGFAGPEEKEPT